MRILKTAAFVKRHGTCAFACADNHIRKHFTVHGAQMLYHFPTVALSLELRRYGQVLKFANTFTLVSNDGNTYYF